MTVGLFGFQACALHSHLSPDEGQCLCYGRSQVITRRETNPFNAELVERTTTSIDHSLCRWAREQCSEGRTEEPVEEFGRGEALCA